MFISVTKWIHSYCNLTVKIITKLDRLGLDRYIIRKGNLIYKVILIAVKLKELYISEISQLWICISIDRTNFAGKMIPESQHKDKLVVCWYIFVAEWSGQVLIHNFRLLYYILHSGHTVFFTWIPALKNVLSNLSHFMRHGNTFLHNMIKLQNSLPQNAMYVKVHLWSKGIKYFLKVQAHGEEAVLAQKILMSQVVGMSDCQCRKYTLFCFYSLFILSLLVK